MKQSCLSDAVNSHHLFLTSGLNWVSGHRHDSAALPPEERDRGIESWVSTRTGLNSCS